MAGKDWSVMEKSFSINIYLLNGLYVDFEQKLVAYQFYHNFKLII